MSDALAHAICPKLKLWLSGETGPCRGCKPTEDTPDIAGTIPSCLWFARDIAAAVAAHLTSNAALDRSADAFIIEAHRQSGDKPPDLDRMKRDETEHERQRMRATMRAAIRAALGGGEHG